MIDFGKSDAILLDIILASMIFAVALSLRARDFTHALRAPRAVVTGLATRVVLLPAATCAAAWALHIAPEIALGMVLVASCPGGTFSNVMAWIAHADVAVSVTITALASVLAMASTPLNFILYGHLNPVTRALVHSINLDVWDVLIEVVCVLGVPLLLGMLAARRYPAAAQRLQRPLRIIAVAILFLFIIFAVSKNIGLLVACARPVLGAVVGQNALALVLGAVAALVARLPRPQLRAVTLEVGIQNSGLGLVILLTFFPRALEMILVVALWGIWDLITGLALALVWSRSRHNAGVGAA